MLSNEMLFLEASVGSLDPFAPQNYSIVQVMSTRGH